MAAAVCATWTSVLGVAAVATMQEGKVLAKKYQDDDNPTGQWRTHARCPGDGKIRVQFQCNAHEDCTKLLRVQKVGNEFILQEKFTHCGAPKLKKRKNSTLTFVEEAALKVHTDSGGAPAKLLVGLTKGESERLKQAGENPLAPEHKRAEGGLNGAQPSIPTYHIVFVCISSVFEQYQDVSGRSIRPSYLCCIRLVL